MASIASHYRNMAGTFRSMAAGFKEQASDPRTPTAIAADFKMQAEEMEVVADRYEQGVRRPWLPIRFKPNP